MVTEMFQIHGGKITGKYIYLLIFSQASMQNYTPGFYHTTVF